jgi:hypothetical protein
MHQNHEGLIDLSRCGQSLLPPASPCAESGCLLVHCECSLLATIGCSSTSSVTTTWEQKANSETGISAAMSDPNKESTTTRLALTVTVGMPDRAQYWGQHLIDFYHVSDFVAC